VYLPHTMIVTVTYGRYSVINNVSNIHVYHSFTTFFAGSPFRVKITDRSRVSLSATKRTQIVYLPHTMIVTVNSLSEKEDKYSCHIGDLICRNFISCVEPKLQIRFHCMA
jgi:hypothetical protein